MNKDKAADPGEPLRRRVYQYLREEMDAGRLLPGAAISLQELGARLGLSKTPMRDALIRLETEGFITIRPRSGITVNILELKDIRYLYEVMGAVESALVQDEFEKFDENLLVHMDELNALMRKAIDDGDLRAYDRPHWQFHEIFMELSNNTFVQRIATPIKQRLWDFPRKSFIKEWHSMVCTEHQQIIDSIRAGDVDRAVHTIRELHWGFRYNEKYIRRVYFLTE